MKQAWHRNEQAAEVGIYLWEWCPNGGEYAIQGNFGEYSIVFNPWGERPSEFLGVAFSLAEAQAAAYTHYNASNPEPLNAAERLREAEQELGA